MSINPKLRGKPIAVAGNPEARHGIVLAKNYEAKSYGIKTGNPLWMAKQLCPNIVFVSPHYDKYLQFSRIAREIYGQYTDQVESFGLDECWLDVTRAPHYLAAVKKLPPSWRGRMKEELCVTVSVGVSYNKIFAKLGSDYKKPDATTVFTRENYRDIIWPLPAADLLYVGPATNKKLAKYGIHAIGDIANERTKPLVPFWAKRGSFFGLLQMAWIPHLLPMGSISHKLRASGIAPPRIKI